MKRRILMMALAMGLCMSLTDPTVVCAAEETASGEAVEQSLDSETFSELLDFVKKKWDSGELESEEDIRTAIEEGEAKFNFDLPQSAEDTIIKTVEAVKTLGLDSDMIVEKAKELYDTYGDEIVENAEAVLAEEVREMSSAVSETIKEQLVEPAKDAAAETAKAVVKNFWTDLKNSVVNFVKNIFHI